MKTNLYNQKGEILEEIQLPEAVFDLVVQDDVIHQAVVTQLANSRQILAHTKDRSEVRGGGKKPWRQKGTGRARHGSIRSPLWKGGGVTFGPSKNRNFSKKINKKTRRKALFMALSGKRHDQKLLVFDAINMEDVKTKTLAAILKVLAGKLMAKKNPPRTLLITPGQETRIQQAINNIKFAKALSAKSLNVVDLLACQVILLAKDAIPVIEKHYTL